MTVKIEIYIYVLLLRLGSCKRRIRVPGDFFFNTDIIIMDRTGGEQNLTDFSRTVVIFVELRRTAEGGGGGIGCERPAGNALRLVIETRTSIIIVIYVLPIYPVSTLRIIVFAVHRLCTHYFSFSFFSPHTIQTSALVGGFPHGVGRCGIRRIIRLGIIILQCRLTSTIHATT